MTNEGSGCVAREASAGEIPEDPFRGRSGSRTSDASAKQVLF